MLAKLAVGFTVNEIRDHTDINEKAKMDLIEHKCEVQQEALCLVVKHHLRGVNTSVKSLRKNLTENYTRRDRHPTPHPLGRRIRGVSLEEEQQERDYDPPLSDSDSEIEEEEQEEEVETAGEINNILKTIGLTNQRGREKQKTTKTAKPNDPITFQVLANTELAGKSLLEKANHLSKFRKNPRS